LEKAFAACLLVEGRSNVSVGGALLLFSRKLGQVFRAPKPQIVGGSGGGGGGQSGAPQTGRTD